MKATGIVRRIDDLGRIVIPKEIRRTLRIREGDPLEIFTDRDGEIILKKYSPIGELSQFARQYADALAQATGHTVCVSDRDQIVAATGSGKKDLEGKLISRQLERAIEARESILASKDDRRYIKVTMEDNNDFVTEAISPIICAGDAIGSVIIFGKDIRTRLGVVEQKLAEAAAGVLGRQMES
jgi:AbrB family transcriptional regulator (stage V sporulation protein T)